jgi:diguanylate cyclase (GGDEF)-like protein/PAS domain S-box-containing protein
MEGARENKQKMESLSSTIENSINMIILMDVEGIIEYVNPCFQKNMGYSEREVSGMPFNIFLEEGTGTETKEEMWSTVLQGEIWHGFSRCRKKNNEHIWCSISTIPVVDNSGKIYRFLVSGEEVCSSKEDKGTFAHSTSYDDTTGLLNRHFFISELHNFILHSAHLKVNYGILLLVNIDQFRLFNDTYGYKQGDELLRLMAKVIKNTISDSNCNFIKKTEGRLFSGRLSGDEFAIFLPFLEEEEGMAVAENIREKVATFNLLGIYSNITACIGAVHFPKHGTVVKELLTRVNVALSRAKDLGQNRYYLFQPHEQDIEKIKSRLAWKNKIISATVEDRFITWFQPLLDIRENRVNHYEVLARMEDMDGTIVAPKRFIDIAEGFGLIDSIDKIMLGKTLQFQSELNVDRNHLTFSVNISGKNLGDKKLLLFIKEKLSHISVDPDRIVFEITETAAVNNITKAVEFIEELRDLGCRFALDDFGAGFSSFAYLKKMRVDYIKIDGSFIKRMHKNTHDQLFVKAIIDVAKGMGIKTVCEFVESEETLSLLKQYGVDYAQGYLIGQPSPNLLC